MPKSRFLLPQKQNKNPMPWIHGRHPTMISMELQRDVPQYMAIPWLMTWVMARTVSKRERERRETTFGTAGAQGQAWG